MANRKKTNKKDQRQLLTIVGVIALVVVGVTVAYAAGLLNSVLNIGVNKVTQSGLDWNVAFQTGSITPTVGGSGSDGRSCGAATATATTVTVADTELSKPGDKCTYALTVENTGGIDATLATITPVAPTSTQCTNSGASMVCGNITYKLTTDSAGETLLTQGGTVTKASGASPTQAMYLVIEFTGSTPSSSTVVQNLGGFTLVYEQK